MPELLTQIEQAHTSIRRVVTQELDLFRLAQQMMNGSDLHTVYMVIESSRLVVKACESNFTQTQQLKLDQIRDALQALEVMANAKAAEMSTL